MERKALTARDLGRRISEAREKAGLSLHELGERMGGISRQQIHQWESGRSLPGALSLRSIADALDVSADWLLGRR